MTVTTEMQQAIDKAVAEIQSLDHKTLKQELEVSKRSL